MELWISAVWVVVGAAVGTVVHHVNRRLVPPPESAERIRQLATARIVTAVVFGAFACRIGDWPQLLSYSLITTLGICLALTDLSARRLPNTLIAPTYLALLTLLGTDAVTTHDTTQLLRSVAAMTITFFAFAALYALVPEQLGGGDVKLAGLIGLVLARFSWNAVFTGILMAWLLAASAGLILRLSHKFPDEGLPLGTFLITAAIVEALVTT